MEKEELLNELYGLRAGLSVYSEEADTLQEIEDKSWEKESEQLAIASDVRGIDENGTSYYLTPMQEVELLVDKYGFQSPLAKQLVKEYKLDMKIYDNNSAYYSENPSEEVEKKYNEQCRVAEKIYEKWLLSDEMETCYIPLRAAFSKRGLEYQKRFYDTAKANHNRYLFRIILFTLLTIGMGVVFFLFGLERTDFWKYVMLGGIGLFALFVIIYLIKQLRYNAYYKSVMDNWRELKLGVAHPEKTPKMIAAFAARNQVKVIVAEREKKTYPIYLRTEELYKALQKEYVPVLDERNWKNLDLIIFALETGRADTLKEALQYADGEMRTKRIEKAIEKATSTICQTIQSGFASLEATIHNCYNRLSAQIQDIGGKILASNQQILNSQREMLSEQRFTNALLAKANTTSAQMMQDVHKIRNNSDYLNMRLRNG